MQLLAPSFIYISAVCLTVTSSTLTNDCSAVNSLDNSESPFLLKPLSLTAGPAQKGPYVYVPMVSVQWYHVTIQK